MGNRQITRHAISIDGAKNSGNGNMIINISTDFEGKEAMWVLQNMFPDCDIVDAGDGGWQIIKSKPEKEEKKSMNLIKELEQNKLIAEKE